MKRGEITTGTLVTLGFGVIVAISGFFAKSWFTDTRVELTSIKTVQSQNTQKNSQQDTDIAVFNTKIDILDIKTTRMENKVDLLLENQGLIYKEKMPKNSGFIEPTLTEDNYLLGSSPLPQIVLQESGDWSMFAPKFEPQRKKFETYNCTSFNTLDCIQRLLKRLGIDENYSDRFTGITAGTKEGGNDPHTVAEALRKNGLIPEDLLPFSDNLKNLDEYYSFKGADEAKCRKAGLAWLDRFEFGHEYVFHPSDTNKQEKMMEALKYSPLGVSVDAWNEYEGVYIKDQGARDNHWTVCVVGFVKDKYWIIDDSYLAGGNNFKKLAWNYDFGWAKRYHISKKKTDAE